MTERLSQVLSGVAGEYYVAAAIEQHQRKYRQE